MKHNLTISLSFFCHCNKWSLIVSFNLNKSYVAAMTLQIINLTKIAEEIFLIRTGLTWKVYILYETKKKNTKNK